MNKNIIFFLGFISILLASFILPGYFSAADLLQNIPSFSTQKFMPSKNSLLADPVFQFEPWREYAKKRILSGELPYWNPYNGSGSPFLANPQTAVFFPLNGFYYLFPTQAGLYAVHLLKLYFIGVFTYLYLSSLKVSSKGSILGAFIVVFSGFSLVWLQWPHTNVLLFFPLLLFLTEKIARQKNNSSSWYALMAFTYLLAITGGHPETLFHVLLLHSVYIVFRLWVQKSRLYGCITAIFFGFLMGAFLILPFLEYLLHSSTLFHRTGSNTNFYLSPIGFLQFFFPFLSGAPHQPLYRSLHDQTNFQEGIGGYVGAAVFLTAIWGSIVLWKNRYIKYWVFVSVFIILLAYGIWPFTLINSIPPLTMTVNVRLIGFVIFGLVTIFSLTLDAITKRDRKIIRLLSSKLAKKAYITSTIILAIIYVFSFKITTGDQVLLRFLPYLRSHLGFILLTTLIYVLLVFLYSKRRFKTISLFGIGTVIFLQTGYLFWNYNPVISKEMFYPQTKLTQVLTGLPKGNILEVGNMNFPENISLVYGLPQARNNDAIELFSYKNVFDRAFPIKNRWSRVEEPKIENLRKLGVHYLISDYDIRLKKKTIQEKQGEVLRDLLEKKKALILFHTNNEAVIGIRILFATFNKDNKCELIFSLQNQQKTKKYFQKIVSCRRFNNFMFYTVYFPKGIVEKEQNYALELRLLNSNKDNQVALVGQQSKPFFELLYKNNINNKYDKLNLIWNENNLYLWAINDSSFIDLDGSYKLQKFYPERVVLSVNAKKKQKLIVKIPYYPGWEVFVDKQKVSVEDGKPFLMISLPEGKHSLIIKYTPYSFYIGLIVSIFSGIGFVLILLFTNKTFK